MHCPTCEIELVVSRLTVVIPVQPGDVVRLKSGGHSMTVATVDCGGAFCYWHDCQGCFECHEFPLIVLEHAKPNVSPL